MMKSLMRLQVASRTRIRARKPSRYFWRARARQPATAVSLSRAHRQSRRARAQGQVPRVGAGLPVDVRQPAAAALVYSFVFGVVMPGARAHAVEPYPLFLFCGILPWTWFQSSTRKLRGADGQREPAAQR